MIAIAVLVVPVLIVESVIANPGIQVGVSRHNSGTEISWAQQSPWQRTQHLASVGLIVCPFTLFPIVYLFIACDDQRNPLTFDKSSNQIRKGTRVLASLSAATAIAVVHETIRRPASRGPTRIFIRFHSEPWSFQFLCYHRNITADRVAAVLAEFLSLPIIYDPMTLNRPPMARTRRWGR